MNVWLIKMYIQTHLYLYAISSILIRSCTIIMKFVAIRVHSQRSKSLQWFIQLFGVFFAAPHSYLVISCYIHIFFFCFSKSTVNSSCAITINSTQKKYETISKFCFSKWSKKQKKTSFEKCIFFIWIKILCVIVTILMTQKLIAIAG